jgi:hypothetical protein
MISIDFTLNKTTLAAPDAIAREVWPEKYIRTAKSVIEQSMKIEPGPNLARLSSGAYRGPRF